MEKAFSVEFLGLPGSGKTTLAEALTKMFTASGLEVVSHRDIFEKYACQAMEVRFPGRAMFRLESLLGLACHPIHENVRGRLFAAFQQRHPAYVALCESLIENSTFSPTLKQSMKRWLKNEGACWEIYERTKKNHPLVFLNDEGFIHRATVYFGDVAHTSLQAMNQYFDLSPKHDIIGAILIRPEEAMARRPKHNPCFQLTDTESASGKRELMERFMRTIDCFVARSERKVVLAADGNVDENVDKIFRSIKELDS